MQTAVLSCSDSVQPIKMRKLLQHVLVGGVAAFLASAGSVALAQSTAVWPSRPLQIVVGYPAGGPADRMARILAASIQKATGQPVIVESKVGGSGIVGSQYVIAAKDGHTVYFHSAGGHTVRPHTNSLKYDPWKELIPVTTVTVVPTVFVGSPNLPARTLGEVVAYAKVHPGKLNVAIIGLGTTNHLYTEVLKSQAKFDGTNVPYTGAAPALQALMAGDADIVNSDITNVAALVQSGKLVAYAVASETRSPFLPEVPTTAEAGFPGVVGNNMWGMFAPTSMPKAHIDRLRELVTAALQDKATQDAFTASSLVPSASTSEAFVKAMKEEEARLVPLIKAHNIRMD